MTIISHLSAQDRELLACLLAEGRQAGGFDMTSHCDRLARQFQVADEYRSAVRKLERARERPRKAKA